MKIHRLVSLAMYLLVALLVVLPFAVAFAQKPVKTDVLPYFDKVPAPPTAFSPGLKQPAGFAELAKQLGQLQASIANGRTAEQSQQQAAYQKVGQQASAAGLDKMTDQQKLAYMQQQGAAMPGYNAEAMQLAQKMQDPAFQAKLAKMSDAEKAQFMQQQMAPAGSAQQRMVQDPAFQAAQAELMQQMKNPAFRAAWEKKSEAEQDAYTEQLMRKHGLDEARMKTIAGKQTPTKMAPLVATAATEAMVKMIGVPSEQPKTNFDRVSEQLQRELETVLAEQRTRSLPEAREGDCPGQQKVYDQQRGFLKRRLDLMTKYLPQLTAAWSSDKAALKARLTPFQVELAKIQYGEAIQRPEEKSAIAGLAGGQQFMLQAVEQVATYSARVYDLNKEYVELKKAHEQPFACELGTCFPATARVTLADGQEVAISRVRPGTLVLGYDAATGQLRPARVQRLDIHDEQAYPLVQLTIGTPAVYAGLEAAPLRPEKGTVELTLTPNHPVLTADGLALRADQLQPSDELRQLNAQGQLEATHLSDRQAAGTTRTVYNLRTETGNYFVSGVLVGSK